MMNATELNRREATTVNNYHPQDYAIEGCDVVCAWISTTVLMVITLCLLSI